MYKALISFSGLISMSEGEVREIGNPEIVKELLRAGFIEETDDIPMEVVEFREEEPKEETTEEVIEEKKPEKKTKSKKTK